MPPPPADVPAPANASGGGDKPRRGRLIALVTAAVLVVGAAAAGGVWWMNRDDTTTDDEPVILEAATSRGESPFTDSIADDVEVSDNVLSEAAEAGLSGQVSAEQTGLYGGTTDNSACDAGKLAEFLAGDTDKNEAWAEAIGIDVDEVESFIDQLTPLVLLHDTAVMNHGYSDGVATPYAAVLESGTAVLVDPYGVPAVRCACGNPLTTPTTDLDVSQTSGEAWDSYEPESVVGVTPADEPLEQITSTDIDTGDELTIRIGSTEMVAWSGPFDMSGHPVSYIWNGSETVTVTSSDDIEILGDSLIPVGFIGDTGIFRSVAGAHGHNDSIYAIDTTDGTPIAQVECFACDAVAVTDSDVVAVESYELLGHRWSADLSDHETFDLPEAEIAQPEPEFGDPYPWAYVLGANDDAVFVSANHVDDGDASQIWNHQRVLRIDDDGTSTWSDRLDPLAGATLAALSPDGSHLAVTAANTSSVMILDSKTLEQSGSTDRPDQVEGFDTTFDQVIPQRISIADDESIQMLTSLCTGQDLCEQNFALIDWDPDTEQWEGEATQAACVSASGSTRGSIVGELQDGYQTDYTLTIEIQQADDSTWVPISGPTPAGPTCLAGG